MRHKIKQILTWLLPLLGNGVDTSNKSDAFTVLFDGTTTIAGSVTAPSFIGDGSGLTNLPSGDYGDLTNTTLVSILHSTGIGLHK